MSVVTDILQWIADNGTIVASIAAALLAILGGGAAIRSKRNKP